MVIFSGNTTYKAVQQATGAIGEEMRVKHSFLQLECYTKLCSCTAIGPIIQGLNRPVNDLSRGCTVADIVNTVRIEARLWAWQP